MSLKVANARPGQALCVILGVLVTTTLAGCGQVGTGSGAPLTSGAPSAASAGVTVASSPTVSPTVSLNASPGTVSSGSSSTVSWSSTNASSCTASGGWSGSEPTSGSASTGALSASKTYTLTCSGTGGSASQSVTVNVASTTVAGGPSCSATSGGLTLRASAVRAAGISPLLVFFDTTAGSNAYPSAGSTTDTANLGGANNAIQDVYYSWNFGDTGASGTGTWAYGSNSGKNSKNTATGPVAAHLYITNGSDTSYPVTVTAYDGTNTASCQLSVAVYDPVGANGFPGSATTCVSATTMPVAGSGGCPAGAAVLQQSNMGTALTSALGSGKRVLFHCGDTFSGSYTVAATVNKASIGAYGGCENTTTSRPIFRNTGSATINIIGNTSGGATDIRVADIDFEDGTYNANAVIAGYTNTSTFATQTTVYNVKCNLTRTCFMSEATQSGIIASTETGQSTTGVYINVGNHQCLNGALTLYCGQSAYNQSLYSNLSYNAAIGNSFDAGASPGAGTENTRIGGCRMCVVSNNTFTHVYGGNSLLKIHDGNAFNSQATWLGEWTEVFEISDNLFINGPNNGYDISFAPQNQEYDERLRYGIIERNLFSLTNAEATGPLISAIDTTLRNNVAYSGASSNSLLVYGFYATHQGGEPANQPGTLEIYNNTCYGPTTASRFQKACVQIDSNTASFLENNLVYNAGAAITAAGGTTGNTVSNNTANSTATFSPANASGAFHVITDFMPAQNYSGGTKVPAWYDANSVAWSPTWSLGVLKP